MIAFHLMELRKIKFSKYLNFCRSDSPMIEPCDFYSNPVTWRLLKVVSATFWLVFFLSLKESTCEIWKNIFFISLQNLFLFARKSNFGNLDIQIS